MERVRGIGGAFFRAKDPQALARWYSEHLGIDNGLEGDTVWWQEKGPTVWAPFPDDTEKFSPKQRCMFNFRVRDLDAMLAQLRAAGASVDEQVEIEAGSGRFGYATDPEGNRIELWEPTPDVLREPSTSPRTTTAAEVRSVKAWHGALNAGDVDRLVALSHPEIEVVGPRGAGRGAQLLREWVGRAGIHLEPRRVFHRADTVVVEQEAEWRSVDTGQVTGRQTVGSVFIVRDDRITRVVRHPDLADALRAVNLDESHETRSD